MKLEWIVESIKDILLEPPQNSDIEIKSVSCDSRKVSPGAIYVAIRGAQFDGDDFIGEAINMGAVAIVTESSLSFSVPAIRVKNSYKALSYIAEVFYQRPASQMDLIGITGTNGKSSTAYILDSILRDAGKSTGMIGTILNRFGDFEETAELTTPDAINLQQLFCRMKEKRVKVVSMEVSSHALSQYRIGNIPFKSAVFTNLTQDHLDYHGDMESYFSAKKKIFEEFLHESGKAVINIDDPYGNRLLASIDKKNTVSVGKNEKADFVIRNIKYTREGSCFEVQGVVYETRLTGEFNIYNAALAAVTAVQQGVEVSQIVESLKKFSGVPGRLELFTGKSGIRVFVDYAHTPDALRKALEALKGRGEKLLCVFGCGGDRDKTKRPLMARAAEEIADEIWVTDDNPRTENPASIRREILQGFKYSGKVHEQGDRYNAIYEAVSGMSKNDILLVAGKGHENYQIYGKVKTSYCDRQTVKEILEKIGA